MLQYSAVDVSVLWSATKCIFILYCILFKGETARHLNKWDAAMQWIQINSKINKWEAPVKCDSILHRYCMAVKHSVWQWSIRPGLCLSQSYRYWNQCSVNQWCWGIQVMFLPPFSPIVFTPPRYERGFSFCVIYNATSLFQWVSVYQKNKANIYQAIFFYPDSYTVVSWTGKAFISHPVA